jgi:hypothetical protein
MTVHEYLINADGQGRSQRVAATEIRDTTDFVDFYDETGLVLRLRKADVHSIVRNDRGRDTGSTRASGWG